MLKAGVGEVDVLDEDALDRVGACRELTAMGGDTGFFATPRLPASPTTAPTTPSVDAPTSSPPSPGGQAPPPPYGQAPLASPASRTTGPPLAGQRSDARSPTLGIVACLMVAFGVGWTLLAGNLGGLIGMPVMLTGTVLGAVSWGRHRSSWGMVAVVGTLAVIGLAVLSEFVRML